MNARRAARLRRTVKWVFWTPITVATFIVASHFFIQAAN